MEFWLRVKKLAARPFFPVADLLLVPVYESFATIFLADELALLHYHQTTWFGLSVGGRRMDPIFPHHRNAVLLLFEKVKIRLLTWTTNSVEAYDRSSNAVPYQRPASLLLKSVHSQQALTQINDIYRGEGMEEPRTSPLSTQGQERIDSFVESHSITWDFEYQILYTVFKNECSLYTCKEYELKLRASQYC